MPFFSKDAKEARGLAREAEKFARLLRTIPVSKTAPPHPEIKAAHASFKRINTHLATRNAKGEVTVGRKFRIGREFQRIGTALRKRPTPPKRRR